MALNYEELGDIREILKEAADRNEFMLEDEEPGGRRAKDLQKQIDQIDGLLARIDEELKDIRHKFDLNRRP
jgi:hypothetical protein